MLTQADIARDIRVFLITHHQVSRALGEDTHPGGEQFHRYWTIGKGREKWIHEPHRWTALYHHLLKYLPPEEAKRTAERWFQEAVGYAPGSDLNRIHSGKPPRGKLIGPG